MAKGKSFSKTASSSLCCFPLSSHAGIALSQFKGAIFAAPSGRLLRRVEPQLLESAPALSSPPGHHWASLCFPVKNFPVGVSVCDSCVVLLLKVLTTYRYLLFCIFLKLLNNCYALDGICRLVNKLSNLLSLR